MFNLPLKTHFSDDFGYPISVTIGHKYLELKPNFKGLEASEIFRILQKSNEEENVIAKVVEDLPPPRGPRTRAAIYEPTDQKGVVDVEISPITVRQIICRQYRGTTTAAEVK